MLDQLAAGKKKIHRTNDMAAETSGYFALEIPPPILTKDHVV